MAQSDKVGKRTGGARGYWFFSILVVVLTGFIALLVLELSTLHQRESDAGARNVLNMARVLEQHTLSTIGKADNTLADVVAEYGPYLAGDEPSPKDINRGLKRYLSRLPESQSLRVVDGDGRFIYDADGKLSSANIADRAYFQRNRDAPQAGLVISEPIFARITNNWVITLSRRIEHRDGRFAGLVQAAVRTDYFQSFYQTLDAGPGGVVALYDTHLRLVARHPALPHRLGLPLHNSLVEQLLREGVREGVYDFASAQDGKMRRWGFHRVESLPFYVLVGVSHDTLYAEWRRAAWIYTLAAGALGLSMLLLAMLWQRSYSRVAEVAEDMSAAFARSDSRNRALLDSIPDFAWLNDVEGRFVAVNQTYALALERQEGEMVGRMAADFWPPETAALLETWRRDVLRESRSARYEDDIPLPGVGKRRMEAILVPVRDASGSVIGSAGIARDVTERKVAEQALRELNETLEQRVREELAKNREKDHLLIQQSRLAAMGEMAHNIAHQWRQPLSALLLILNNIKDDFVFGEISRQSLDAQVHQGTLLAHKMSSVIDDFRDFFRPNEERTQFRLSDAVHAALGILDGGLDSQGVHVVVEVLEDVEVTGYPNEFAQVLINLLTNSREALRFNGMAEGNVRVRIEADGAECKMTVSDGAGGIPEEIMGRIFDPYFTTKESGIGLGLYMSRMIVEANMGGRITARNRAQGADFVVILPRSPG